MKIAIISRVVFGLHGYGGMQRHVLELARFLARTGQEVTIVTTAPSHPEVAWEEPGVELQVIRASRLPLGGIPDRIVNYPYWTIAAGEYVASKDFDIVHAHGMAGWGYGRLLARGRARAPMVVNPHGMEEWKISSTGYLLYFPLRYFARQAARQAVALIGTDTRTAEEIPEFLGVPPQKVVLIPNGIDIESAVGSVNPQGMDLLAQRLEVFHRSPLLLSVGNLESNKGFDLLVDALARIRPSLPSTWCWVLVGEGPERSRIEARVRTHRLTERVRLVGQLHDMMLHNLYELATLFIHPTLYEGSSIVTLEAMAHSRPIVATAVGGIPDKVFPSRNGYLVSPGDPAELGDKILLALRDPRRLREMGEASLAIACQTFDWPQAVRMTVDLYKAVLPRPAPPPARLGRLRSRVPQL